MVVGESQILGQLRQALNSAQQHGTVGSTLNALFQQALRVGKRVQAETTIGGAGRSLVTAAYDLLAERYGPLRGRRMVVLGAGTMAGLAARTAAAQGALLTIVNRTPAKAERLAEAVDGTAVPLAELDRALAGADVLLTCTGGRDLKLGPDRLSGSPVRAVIDLAVPSDIDPAVAAPRRGPARRPGSPARAVTALGVPAATDPAVAAPGIAVSDIAGLGERLPGSVVAGVETARGRARGEVADFLGARGAAQVA